MLETSENEPSLAGKQVQTSANLKTSSQHVHAHYPIGLS